MSAYRNMREAPRDGALIRIRVTGGHVRGSLIHELPYDIRYYRGRWCYARHNTPLFDWHQPQGWKRAQTFVEAA